jgi:hypothetical protein
MYVVELMDDDLTYVRWMMICQMNDDLSDG